MIVPSGRKCSVLGSNNTLYHIAGHRLCASGCDDLVSRFDPTNTKNSRQEFLPPMPNGMLLAHALFLGNKLYCLGGYQENKPWAMAYDLSLDRWDSLVDPPRRPENTYNIFFNRYRGPNPNYLLTNILFLIGLLYFLNKLNNLIFSYLLKVNRLLKRKKRADSYIVIYFYYYYFVYIYISNMCLSSKKIMCNLEFICLFYAIVFCTFKN